MTKEELNKIRDKLCKEAAFQASCNGGAFEEDFQQIWDQCYQIMKSEMNNCPHPGCCCVCGHTKQCPEDGPSIIEGIHD